MRVIFYKSIFLFALLFFFSQTFSQLILPKMVESAPQTPTGGALGKYGIYPVSLNTGLINISVPIYEIKTPKLSVPITLSYHASGIRVTDISSWTGLGWSILAGGSINRTIMGKADELSGGYLSSASEQEIKNVGDVSYDKTMQAIQDYMWKIEVMQIDPEPDLFQYSYGGSSGRFLYNKDKTTLIRIPYSKSKIDIDFANKLIIVTETDGTVYRFGKALDGTIYTESTNYDNYGNDQLIGVTSNWLLTTIISSDKKDTIQFKYTSNAGSYITDRVERFTVYSEHLPTNGAQLPSAGTNSSSYKDVQNDYAEQLLSEIIFRNGKVVFETAQDRTDIANTKRLSAIKIYSQEPSDNSYTLQKTVQFSQSYFDSERMRLDSVSFTAPGASQAQVYRFNYNSTSLPVRSSKARDYWGYYNGATGNTSLIPPISIPEGIGYLTYNTSINREVDFSYAKARSLEKITYPTGGYTEFEYEANKYLEGATTKTAGGMRIRQARSYDGISPVPIKKTYVYADGYISIDPKACYTNIAPYYKMIAEIVSMIEGTACNGIYNESVKVNSFTSTPALGLTNYDGNIVFYTDITEYEGELSNHQGYTTYKYDYVADNIVSYTFPGKTYREVNTWRRGQLLQQKVFNKEGLPASSVINTYSNIAEDLYTIQGILIGRVYSLHISSCIAGPTCQGCAPNAFQNQYSFANYSVRTGLKKLLQNVAYAYDQNDPSKFSTVTTDYLYDNSNYEPSEITVTNSTGEKIVTKFKYPGNYAVDPNSTDPVSQGIKFLKDNNVLGTPVETYQQRKAADNSLRTIGAVFTTYRNDLPVPSAGYVLDLTGPVTDFTPSAVSGYNISKDSRYRLAVSYNQYDAAANIAEQNKANDIKQSIIWGYKSTYPVAQVTGAEYNTILSTANLSQTILQNPANDQALRTELNKIRTNFPNAVVTTYTYKPLIGVTSVTDNNNQTAYYEYDEFGRLKLIKDKDGNIVKTFEYKYKQ